MNTKGVKRRPGRRPHPAAAPESLGWVKLYRAILQHRLWDLPPSHRVVAITVLLSVGRKAVRVWNGRDEIPLDAGEVLTSQEALAEAAGRGITRRIVRRALANLESVGFLRVRRSTVGRAPGSDSDSPWSGRGIVVTVSNWERYQPNGDEAVPTAVPSRSVLGPFAGHKQEVEKERRYIEGPDSADVPGGPGQAVEPSTVAPRVLAAFIEEFDREPIDGDRAVLADLGGFPIDAVRSALRETREKSLALTYARAVLRYNASAAAAGSTPGGRA